MHSGNASWLSALLLASFNSVMLAQSTLYAEGGVAEFDEFGSAVSGAGDVDGDGFADFIVGAPFNATNGGAAGSAYVFSGADGSLLYTFLGGAPGDQFGSSVSGAGDVDADGFSDVIVGALGANTNGSDAGAAYVFSGLDGSILYTIEGDSIGDRLGASVSGAGDVNQDGFDDVIVGVPFDDNRGSESGSARIVSGLDGSILYSFDGGAIADLFGDAVSGAGDVNQDGFDDVIVGAQLENTGGSNAGSARVFSGADGSMLFFFSGVSAEDRFGDAVNGGGDVNGDGFDDLIVGAFGADGPGIDYGIVRVFSGLDGSTLYTLIGDADFDHFGATVSCDADINSDGFADLVIGVPLSDISGDDAGSVRVFSGVSGAVIYTFTGDSDFDEFGTAVACAGDLDNDGFEDLIAGAPFDDDNGDNAGSIRGFTVLPGSVGMRSAGANPDSYTVDVQPNLGATVTLRVDLTSTGHSFAQIYAFDSPVQIGLQGDQFLLVGGTLLFVLPMLGGPEAVWDEVIPADPAIAGITFYTQAVHTVGPTPFTLSNALDLTVGF